MFGFLFRKLDRRCPVCQRRIEGGGVRRGLEVFCSSAHLRRYVEESEARERILRWIGNAGGGCC